MRGYEIKLFANENEASVHIIKETESFWMAGAWERHYLCKNEEEQKDVLYGSALRDWLRSINTVDPQDVITEQEFYVEVHNMKDAAMLAEVLEALNEIAVMNAEVHVSYFENGERSLARYYSMGPSRRTYDLYRSLAWIRTEVEKLQIDYEEKEKLLSLLDERNFACPYANQEYAELAANFIDGVKPGMKKTRIIGKLCSKYGIDKIKDVHNVIGYWGEGEKDFGFNYHYATLGDAVR